MTTTFLDLPMDVIDIVIFFLPREDVEALSTTCKELHNYIANSSFIWRELYFKTFGSTPTPYSQSKWPDLFKQRQRAGLYTWGQVMGGRLGYSVRSVPAENLTRRGFSTGVSTATKVPGLERITLADVSAGGFSFQILSDNGEIYSLGNWHSGHTGPGPKDGLDFNWFLHSAREQEDEQQRDNAGNNNGPVTREDRVINPPDLARRLGRLGGVQINSPMRMPPRNTRYNIPTRETHQQEHEQENHFLHKEHANNLEPGVKFISVSSGRCHFIALDDTGKVWSWDNPRLGRGVGIRFDITGENHKVLRCVAGWACSVAYLYDYGLVYWDERLALKEGEESAVVKHTLVPNTHYMNGPHRVVDFIVGEGFLVYLTSEGKVYRNDLIGEESYQLEKFGDNILRLSGSFRNFACFTRDDSVLMGAKDNQNEPIIIPELQQRECISIAVGDYHFLALLKDGTLLSWGLDSHNCGCLGLGKDVDQFEREGSSSRVRKPTKAKIEGKVVAIAAAGWQSSAIVIDD